MSQKLCKDCVAHEVKPVISALLVGNCLRGSTNVHNKGKFFRVRLNSFLPQESSRGSINLSPKYLIIPFAGNPRARLRGLRVPADRGFQKLRVIAMPNQNDIHSHRGNELVFSSTGQLTKESLFCMHC